MKGLVISGVGSGVGKTSIATGLMSKLSRTMDVQAYKVGPDFIDPMYHSLATGRRSRNLDSFMMSEDTVRNLVGFSSKDADICVVEGVRGLYEGLSGTDDRCSTAEMSKILGFPVVLVINARSLTRSVAAIINGFQSFDKDVDIAGVILNNVSGKSHEMKIREAIEKYTDTEIIGFVRKDDENTLGQRHLGLETINESCTGDITKLENLVSDLDTDRIMDICESGTRDELPSGSPYTERRSGMKAAVPMDDAFCFYYHENIECLQASGVEVSFFKPACGDGLPDADIYYLGGGYPELHLDDLSANRDFTEGLRTASDDGKVILGECGGMMSMCSSVMSAGEKKDMAGIFRADACMTGRHGPKYVIADTTSHNPLFPKMRVYAHEFHYSDVLIRGSCDYGYDLIRGEGIDGRSDGMIRGNSMGTYMHQHALSTKDWASGMIDRTE